MHATVYSGPRGQKPQRIVVHEGDELTASEMEPENDGGERLLVFGAKPEVGR
jgi:hypothetical protein